MCWLLNTPYWVLVHFEFCKKKDIYCDVSYSKLLVKRKNNNESRIRELDSHRCIFKNLNLLHPGIYFCERLKGSHIYLSIYWHIFSLTFWQIKYIYIFGSISMIILCMKLLSLQMNLYITCMYPPIHLFFLLQVYMTHTCI